MMAYAQVDVIVEGALDAAEVIRTPAGVERYVAQVEREAKDDGLWTEVYILWHEHGLSEEECPCAQYVTDHHPDYAWNEPEDGAS